MTLLTGFHSRAAFLRGYESWRRGDLEEAERALREAAGLRPRAAGALLYLGRVLSERSDLPGALEALAAARAAGAQPGVVEVFTRLVRYDHGETSLELDRSPSVGPTNVLTRSLDTLLTLRERLLEAAEPLPDATPWEARLPLAARWIAEVAGRVLAVTGRALWLRDAEAWVRLHHDVLAEAYWGVEPGQEPAGDPESTGRGEAAEAFLRRDYAKVCDLPREEAGATPGCDPTAIICRAFSLVALGKPGEATRVVTSVGEDPAYAPDARFLQGLAHTAGGRVREAGWCFTRAARYQDIELDQVLGRVSSALSLRWILVE